ncbi:MAG: hypothetical protein AB9846_06130 [Tenuifilaceae bacterium]
MPSKLGSIIIEGHVQGLSNTRALGEAEVPVFVVDKSNCIARYSKYCTKFFYCPDFISEEFVPFLIELAKKENLQGWTLIPSNDHAVYSISKHKQELANYYKIIIPEIDIIENIYDKSKLLSLAERVNIPYPKTQYFLTENDPISDNLSFPFITKGRNGLSFYKALGKKAILSNNELELRAHLKQIAEKFTIERSFTQELIPFNGTNKTVSFTAFCVDGEIKTHWIGEKVREHPIRFGTATFARSIECVELLDPSQKLLHELKYTGVCEVEYLLDPRDKKYKLIEINARTWLWVGLARACGINYAVMVYNHLNGIENIYPSNYKIGMNWVNYITDTPFSLIALFKGRLTIKEYFSSFKGKRVDAFFSWRDIKPSIMFFVLSVYIAIKRK